MSGFGVYYLLLFVGGFGLVIHGVVLMCRPRRRPETPNSYPQGMIPMMIGSTAFFLAIWHLIGL